MHTSVKWILAAFALLGCIAQFSIMVDSRGHFAGELEGQLLEPELQVDLAEEPVEADFVLSLEDDYVMEKIRYGTQAELYRFSLKASGPYTVRYLTLAADTNALQREALEANVELFEVNRGKVDYTKPVGHGETWSNGEVRIRLFNSDNGPYLGEKGTQEFLVTSTILKDPKSAERVTLRVSMPQNPLMDWAWLQGHLEGSWLNATEWLGYLALE